MVAFHNEKCECAICKYGPEFVEDWERDCLQKTGWFAHQVPGNYHTHGVLESFGHQDIQVVLQIDPNAIHRIVSGVINDIKEGKQFQAGQNYSKVIQKLDVTFIEATENDRTVLRLIFPDANGKLLKEEMDPDYAAQYDVP